jgi:hypothetical protein
MFLVAVLKLSPLLLIIIGLAFFACVTAQVICFRTLATRQTITREFDNLGWMMGPSFWNSQACLAACPRATTP